MSEQILIFNDFFKQNSILEIKEIEWWLNENWEKYRDLKDVWECSKCPTNLGLPCICKEPDEEYLFFIIYEELDEVLQFHKKERYFKNEIETYQKVKNSKEDLIKWVSKNEKLGTDDYLSFPYRDDEKEIRIFAFPLKINWTINKSDFKYTIEFLELFKRHFWHEQLLPHSIEKIIKDMEQTK